MNRQQLTETLYFSFPFNVEFVIEHKKRKYIREAFACIALYNIQQAIVEEIYERD